MKTATIKNEFDVSIGQLTRFDRKYLYYVKEYDQPDSIADKVFSALRSGNLEEIETSLVVVANNMRADILLIGLSCLIIEREGIYTAAGYRSYLEYSGRLFEKLEIAPQTLSDAKNIMAAYIDHYKGLTKNGFKLGRNSHKLRYLEEAVVNHGGPEAYKKVSTSTFRDFVEWAKKTEQAALPAPVQKIKIRIDNGRIFIDGQNILNIPDTVPEKVRESVTKDLAETFRIRASGNEPFIVETYGKGEQRAIDIFLKKYRSNK